MGDTNWKENSINKLITGTLNGLAFSFSFALF